MEFFLEFVFTIVFSLIFSFFIAKVLSAATTDDNPEPDDSKKMKTSHHYHKFHDDDSTDFNSKIEKKLGFRSKLGESIDDDQVFTQIKTTQQRLQLSPKKPEKKEGFSPVEVDKTEIDLGFKKEELGMEEKEEIVIKEDDDDDWEGIERSEMEMLFGAAVAYVSSIGKISSLGSDLKLQLYGFHQVVMEGPCCVPQPMALKLSARAKWNAWQQLGNMSREAAMEQYINLVSRSIPGWMKHTVGEDVKQDLTHNDASTNITSDLNPALGEHRHAVVERSLEEHMPHDD